MRSTIGALAIVVGALLVCCGDPEPRSSSTPAQPRPTRSADDERVQEATGPVVAYRGATLIDGTGGDAIENATVLLQGSEILAAGPEVEVPDGAEIVDVSGRWIVPGLIDAHVHFMVSARVYTRPNMIDLTDLVPYEEEVAWIQARIPTTLRGYLCAGVTGAVSAGGPFIEYEARTRARAMPDAPTVFVAHGPITQVPEFMARRFFPLFDGDVTLKSARSPEAGAALVREAAASEADLIKTAYDGGGSRIRKWLQWNYVGIHEAIVAEAADHGFPVTTHAHELEPARAVMATGVDSLQHIPVDGAVDDEFIALAREKGVIVVPTLALRQRTFVDVFDGEYDLLPIERTCGDPQVMATWTEVEEMPGFADERLEGVAANTGTAIANTRALFAGGVALAAGTDAGNFGMLHGASLHVELAMMNEAGIPPADLIVAATLHAARVAGQERRYGSVEANKAADFLVLSRNPLDDVANLQAIDLVVKHGRAFRQQDLLPPSDPSPTETP